MSRRCRSEPPDGFDHSSFAAPDVFAHLRGDPHPFRRTQASKDSELHRAGLVVGVAAEHGPERTRSTHSVIGSPPRTISCAVVRIVLTRP